MTHFISSNEESSDKETKDEIGVPNDASLFLSGFGTEDYLCVFQSLLNLFLFETKQTNLPLLQMRQMCFRLEKKLSKEAKGSEYNLVLRKLPKSDQQMLSFSKSFDVLFHRFALLFSSYKVLKVLFVIGSTVFNPKQSLYIEFEAQNEREIMTAKDEGQGPENMGYDNCSRYCVQNVHRFYFATKFMSLFKSKP